MNNTLNLETFNKILLGAIKKDKHVELLEKERDYAMELKIQEMENLVYELNTSMQYIKTLKTINAINEKYIYLTRQLEKLKGIEND